MATTHATLRPLNLIDLMRRMAAVPPAALAEIVDGCVADSDSEVRQCVSDYGPFGGLVRLGRLFPHGYLDASSSAATPGAETYYREKLGLLTEALDHHVPGRLNATKTSIFDARLDDVVFREIRATCDDQRGEAYAGLLKQLFSIYGVAPQLPRLADLVAVAEGSVDLSNAVVVAHQHILGTVVTQFEALWELGLLPSRTYVVGKPYSTNRLAAMYLESKGCEVRDGLKPISASPRWAIQAPNFTQADNAQILGHVFGEIVRGLPKMDVDKLIVLDDGGLILGWLNRAFDSEELFSSEEQEQLARLQVVGVEQTTFGRHLIERLRPAETA